MQGRQTKLTEDPAMPEPEMPAQPSQQGSQSEVDRLQPIKSENNDDWQLDSLHMQSCKIEIVEMTTTMKGWENGKFVDLAEPRKQLHVASENLVPKLPKAKNAGDTQIRAHAWFNLIEKENGEIGWSQHPKGNLNKFLKAMRCAAPKELVGKPAIIRAETKESAEGEMSTKLGFIF